MSNHKNDTVGKTFRSGKNIVIAIIINSTVIGLVYLGVQHALEGKWILPIVGFVTSVYLISTFYNTKYIIQNDCLLIVSGFFKSRHYSIRDFDSVKKVRSMIASSASGIRRIEIKTKKGDLLIISPKDQDDFINWIKRINPNINLI